MRLSAVLATALLATGFVAGCAKKQPSAGARKTAPNFTLKDSEGKEVRLADYRGKVVLLDFWATWCGPCRIEIPWFSDMERQKKDKGFAVLGVSMDDDGWKVVKPFMSEMKMNYRVLLGNDQVAKDYGGLDALPTTFVIDRDGKIAFAHVGLASRKDIDAVIDDALRGSGNSGRVSLPSLLLNTR
ncbi:MAG TPA: TlpA disulfide reductase family protein [Bryobacteraceae bacterium]|nr:TlpA disulfide reductase family protein [Bryobacteraceae bacterium]